MKFDPWWSREKVASLLEQPVRALLAEGATTRPVAEIDEIIAELDRIDRVAQARVDENVRRANLEAEVRAAIVVEDIDKGDCMERVYGSWHGSHCSRKAKVRVVGVGTYCRQHAEKKITRIAEDRVRDAEKARIERDEITEAERIIDESRRLHQERSDAEYRRIMREGDDAAEG